MLRQLYIQDIKGKGRGVCCTQTIAKGETIELCPLLVTVADDYDTIKSSHLSDYIYSFIKEEKLFALALGFGSLYNHATYNNAAYLIDTENKMMTVYAIKDIPADTEICINYGGDPGTPYEKWFTDRNLTAVPLKKREWNFATLFLRDSFLHRRFSCNDRFLYCLTCLRIYRRFAGWRSRHRSTNTVINFFCHNLYF